MALFPNFPARLIMQTSNLVKQYHFGVESVAFFVRFVFYNHLGSILGGFRSLNNTSVILGIGNILVVF